MAIDSQDMAQQVLCSAKTSDGAQCRRAVSPGHTRCWRHVHGLKAKWQALTRNQSISFLLATVGVVLTAAGVLVGILTWRYPNLLQPRSSDASTTTRRPMAAAEPDEHKYEIFVESATLPVEILCDGRVQGTLDSFLPYTTIEVSQGEHVISARRKGHVIWEKPLLVGGEVTRYSVIIREQN